MCALECIGTVLSLISPCSKSTADFGRTIMLTLLLVTLFSTSSSSPPPFFLCASSSSSARVFVAYNLRPLGCCCCRWSFPNARDDDDGERKNLNLLSSNDDDDVFAAIIAIDDDAFWCSSKSASDDAPWSLLPLLHSLTVLLKLPPRLQLLLLLSERRSFKSARLILFSPIQQQSSASLL